MNTTTIRRTGALGLPVGLSLGVSACGSSTPDTSSTQMNSSSSKTAENAGSESFGPGCKLIPKDGAGSFNGMATAPVATAVGGNPLLKTLVAAVGKADLGDTLNSAKALTVFAPTNDAFGRIPSKALNGLLADKPALTKVLTHHVVARKLAPSQLAGTHKTLAGDTITVKGSGSDFTVGDAKVLCGNISTANATVYVIDTVLAN